MKSRRLKLHRQTIMHLSQEQTGQVAAAYAYTPTGLNCCGPSAGAHTCPIISYCPCSHQPECGLRVYISFDCAATNNGCGAMG